MQTPNTLLSLFLSFSPKCFPGFLMGFADEFGNLEGSFSSLIRSLRKDMLRRC